MLRPKKKENTIKRNSLKFSTPFTHTNNSIDHELNVFNGQPKENYSNREKKELLFFIIFNGKHALSQRKPQKVEFSNDKIRFNKT